MKDGTACRGFPDYRVTRDGRVYSTVPWRGTHSRELAQETHRQGYRVVVLSKPYRKRMLVHVLVAEAFLGEPPDDSYQVRHLDGDPSHNHVDNLAWGTATDNADDSKRHGTFARGSRNGNALLTEKDIVEIRLLLYKGYTQHEVARLFDVSKGCIANVATRSWKHVD